MMIPSFIDPDTAPGEVDVYNMLAHGPDDWIVFHQVDLTSTLRGTVKSRREIDFLIVIPKAGIMCIEVKSHEGIHFDGKFWHPSTIKQDPFKQSLNARYALKRHLDSQGQELACIPLGRCCVFPRSSFSLDANAAVDRWELFDMRAFRGFKDSAAFCAALEDSLRKSIDKEYGGQLKEPLSLSQISRLKGYLAPIQKNRPGLREQIRVREQDAFNLLREQQKPIVKFAESGSSGGKLHNPRLIIDGAAGTGKSWIAMEIARRMADSGKRTALVCFNKLVGEWVATNVSKDINRQNLIAGPAIKLLMDLTGVSVPASPGDRFWDSDIYDAIEEKLTDPEFNDELSFDYLIIDEAQDVLSKPRLFEALMQLAVIVWSVISNTSFSEIVKSSKVCSPMCVVRPKEFQRIRSTRTAEIIASSVGQLSNYRASRTRCMKASCALVAVCPTSILTSIPTVLPNSTCSRKR